MFSTLSQWLLHINSIHFSEIDLGLERIATVAKHLELFPLKSRVIIVGGTNGKGSTVACLEAIYREAGYQVGCYTSPILFEHNEQVRINGESPSNQDFCEVYQLIETARSGTSLTPFEYHTLAALLLFSRLSLDIVLLEVGMGGRLDAVNIVEPDIAIVTSIAIDHAQWLGKTKKAIAKEKAGIFRKHKPAICGDAKPPPVLREIAATIEAPFYQQGKDFSYKRHPKDWEWSYADTRYTELPYNQLYINNLSTSLMAIQLLQNDLSVPYSAIYNGLLNVRLPGRIQIEEGPVTQIFDVAHNPSACALLSDKIKALPGKGKTLAVFSMLADKDIRASIVAIKDVIDSWFIAPIAHTRAARLTLLEEEFSAIALTNYQSYSSIENAYQAAIAVAQPGDIVIVFGSFRTVAEGLAVKRKL